METEASPTDRTDRPVSLMTEAEVAAIFRVTPRTVRRWATQGYLTPVRVGGITRYRAAQVAGLASGKAS